MPKKNLVPKKPMEVYTYHLDLGNGKTATCLIREDGEPVSPVPPAFDEAARLALYHMHGVPCPARDEPTEIGEGS